MADRIDLLIRDADAQWPEAFGARTVFAKRAVAEDEPFGPDWQPLDAVDAEQLWRAAVAADAPESAADVLRTAAAAWGISLGPYDPGDIGATEQLVVAGPSAIAGALEAFRRGDDLDWSTQVIIVATPPAHRQLGALAGALLGIRKPTKIVAATAGKPVSGSRLVASDDAAPEDAVRAKELASA